MFSAWLYPGGDLLVDGVARLTSADEIGLPWQLMAQVAVWVMLVSYFALPEGLFGASLGKAICGLRVIDATGSSFGIRRATVRALIYNFAPGVVAIVTWTVIGIRLGGRGEGELGFDQLTAGETIVGFCASLSVLLLLPALFATARRSNGYAAAHDLLTDSRVVRRRQPRKRGRPDLGLVSESIPDTRDAAMIGVYHLIRAIDESPETPMWLAYDTRLLRRVWIRECSTDNFDPHDPKITIGRPGRLRWIGSWAEEDRRYVVYEALTGKPFLEACEAPQPWASVRCWLHDLATELAAADEDGTLPEKLSLDRVWITGSGRLKLIDFPPPGVEPLEGEATPSELLLALVARALHWQPRLEARNPEGAFLQVQTLDALRHMGDQSIGEVAETLADLEPSKNRVSRTTRLAMLLLLLPQFFLGFSLTYPAIEAASNAARRNSLFNELAPLRDNLAALVEVEGRSAREEIGSKGDPSPADWEAFIAFYYYPVVNDDIVWGSEKALAWIPQEHRDIAERAVGQGYASYPGWREAVAKVERVAPSRPRPKDPHSWKPRRMVEMNAVIIVAWLLFIALPCGVAALLNRRGPVVRVFGVDYVTEAGTKAHRLRLVLRHSVLPFAFVAALCLGQYLFSLVNAPYYEGNTVNQVAILGGLAVALVATTVSSVRKSRGLIDSIADVYPVPH